MIFCSYIGVTYVFPLDEIFFLEVKLGVKTELVFGLYNLVFSLCGVLSQSWKFSDEKLLVKQNIVRVSRGFPDIGVPAIEVIYVGYNKNLVACNGR